MQNINKILCDTERLGDLYSRSIKIIKLQTTIRNELDQPLSDHVYLAHINSEKITLFTDSPVWAAKLRFLTNKILTIIRKIPRYQKVASVTIKVNPSLHVTHTENNLLISSLAAEHLTAVAESTSDAGLRSSLLKLANKSKPL